MSTFCCCTASAYWHSVYIYNIYLAKSISISKTIWNFNIKQYEFSLGIQSSDLGLIDAALAEMSKHGQDPRFAHDIVYLQASVLLLKVKLSVA